MSILEPHIFALFAYSGALISAATFIALGYFLDERLEATSERIHHCVLIATGVGVVLVLLDLGYWRLRRKKL